MANNNFTEAFGKAIQIWNKSRNVSCCAAELAKAINVSVQSVYKWKAGGRISMENVGKIYSFFSDLKECDAAFWGVSEEAFQKAINSTNNLNTICEAYKNATDDKKRILYLLATNENLLSNVAQIINFKL